MAYNQPLAQRIRAALGERPGLTEKKMFGGVGYLLQGNMACGIQGDDLITRVAPDFYPQALSRPFVKPFMGRGKPMIGWILVGIDGLEKDEDLKSWVEQGCSIAQSLPEKK